MSKMRWFDVNSHGGLMAHIFIPKQSNYKIEIFYIVLMGLIKIPNDE